MYTSVHVHVNIYLISPVKGEKKIGMNLDVENTEKHKIWKRIGTRLQILILLVNVSNFVMEICGNIKRMKYLIAVQMWGELWRKVYCTPNFIDDSILSSLIVQHWTPRTSRIKWHYNER